jgi:hypothetical protein
MFSEFIRKFFVAVRPRILVGTLGVLLTTAAFCAGLAGLPVGSASDGQFPIDDPEAESEMLLSPDGTRAGDFGASLAMDGDYLIVGDPSTRSETGTGNDGGAYIFHREGGSWIFQARLTYPGDDLQPQFGCAVSISGDTAVVGARLDNFNGNHGSAFVYVRNGTSWTLQQRINATGSSNLDQFGASVAIDGNLIIVGAFNDTINGQQSGSAYAFLRSGSTWSQEAKLTDVDGNLPNQFGYGFSVDISQDKAIIGVRHGAIGTIQFQPGLAVIFSRAGGVWTREARISAPDLVTFDQFGYDVSIEGDIAVVGAADHTVTPGHHDGAVYVFAKSNGSWLQEQKLTSDDTTSGGKFGASLSLYGNRLVVGEYLADVGGHDSQGAAFEFVRDGTSWSRQNKLLASNGLAADHFGMAVAIFGNRIFSGATGFDVIGANGEGAAYFFIEPPTTPDLRATSDSGISNSDNITNLQDLHFDISGITVGGTLEIRRNGVLIHSEVANQSSVSFSDFGLPANGPFSYTTRQIVGGEVSSLSEPLLVTIDTTIPTVTINQAPGQADPTFERECAFQAVFSENVVNFEASDISLAGSTANVSSANISIGQPLNPRTISVTNILSDGSVTASIPAGRFEDPAGNVAPASTSSDNVVTIDSIRPTVTLNQALGQPDPTTQLPLNFTAVFNEPVTGFEPEDVMVSGTQGGAVFEITGSGTIYNVAMIAGFANAGPLPVRVSIRDGAARDLAGNTSAESTSTDNSVSLDNVRPTVFIQRLQGQPDPAWSFPVRFRVVFSEPITGFGPEDVSLAGSTVNTQNASIEITGDGNIRTVSVSNVTRGGLLHVTVPAGGVHDAFGNPNLPSTGNENTVVLSYVADPGFDLTVPPGLNPNWNSTSTQFATSLCTIAICGNGNGTAGPRLGSGWVWFDGTGLSTAENATASQTIVFPAGGVATLTYYLRIGFVSAPSDSVLVVRIDDTVMQTITEPATAEPAYALRTVDVSAFADGASHVLRFEYARPATGPSDNFTVDDVYLVTPPAAPMRTTLFDFDGDSKADLSIYRPGPGEWWYQKSSNLQVPGFQFGVSTDKIVPGDYTGDGKTDIAIWRPSTGFWFILRSEDFLVYGFPFGTDGDVPVPGDYDGDGKTDAAVFRPSTVTWIINKSSGGTAFHTFGAIGDKPVVADYDGDGKTDIAIYRPSVGEWWYQRSSDGVVPGFQFGSSTDKPVQGDYTGDGKADIAFWRPSTGFWYVLKSEDFLFYGFPWGLSTDVPAPGDFDGDGKFDASVFRPSDTVWYINRSTAGVFIQQFGIATDLPVPAAFVP